MSAERRLVVRHGDREREVLLVGTVSVGRNPSCEISEADPLLSREHAEFRVKDGDVIVRDLGSRNGTRVNGRPIKEQTLASGDRVEVGPLVIEYVAPLEVLPVPPANTDDEATVVLPKRVAAAAARAADAGIPPRVSVGERLPVQAAGPPPPARAAIPADVPPVRPRKPAPKPPDAVASAARPSPPASAKSRATTTAAQGLAFGRAMLLRVIPLALAAFVLGSIPALLDPDERTPLLVAQQRSLARVAQDLVTRESDPAASLDGLVGSLHAYPGVTQVRVIAPDGRVLAPTTEGGTSTTVAELVDGESKFIDGADSVEILQRARTADGRSLIVRLLFDDSRILPPAGGPLVRPIFLVLGLIAAFVVARQLTGLTDTRLSRLGEEIELMTTGQTATGHDPFVLRGGQRVIDAATFVVSQARARGPVAAPAITGTPASRDTASKRATLQVDEGFRVVAADAGSAELLGVSPAEAAKGLHLIDAVTDHSIADEVLRLLALASPGQPAHGVAAAEGGAFRLAIDVSRQVSGGPVEIRFERI